jgi:FkbM family methyltransferase
MGTELDITIEGGFRMRLDTAEAIGRVLAIGGVWEPEVTKLFHRLLSRGDVCVDVGANVGYYTLLAATLVGDEGHVYAVEPSPGTFARLEASIRLNGFRNISPIPVAAGAAESDAVLDDHVHSVLSAIRASAEGTASAVAVRVRPLVSLIDQVEYARLRLVKIDVEGYELEVLRGLEPVFSAGATPAIILELHAGRGAETIPLVRSLIQSYGLTAMQVHGTLGLVPWDEAVAASGVHLLLEPKFRSDAEDR